MMHVVEALRYASFGGFLVFGLLYQTMTRGTWRRRPEGIWLMCLVFLIVQFVGLAVAVTLWGPNYWGRIWFQVIVWVQLALLPLGLIALLLRAQRLTRRARARVPRP
jgi:hypothetical protein